MWSNYFKTAIKVLGRRKFFTFVSLFGISFTLMIIMLVTAFLQAQFGKNPPLANRDRLVFNNQVALKLIKNDTLLQIDSALVDGVMTYDTTETQMDRQSSVSISSGGFSFLKTNLTDLPSAERYSIFSVYNSFDVFLNTNKLTLSATYTDGYYWDIFRFDFAEGRPYTQQAVEQQTQQVVMSQRCAQQYFGRKSGLLGETLTLEGKQFALVGVVKDVKGSQDYASADIFLPYTHMPASTLADEEMTGNFWMAFLAEKPADRESIVQEIHHVAEHFQMPNPEAYNQLELRPVTFLQWEAWTLFFNDDPEDSPRLLLLILGGGLLLFILLPTLNLININVSRILERSAEIGVRKAFGAHTNAILTQFVFENVILTLIGGLIGFALAILLIQSINNSQIIGNTTLAFNLPVFGYSLLACILFGILSGLLPAWRMSRLQIVNALKQSAV